MQDISLGVALGSATQIAVFVVSIYWVSNLLITHKNSDDKILILINRLNMIAGSIVRDYFLDYGDYNGS